MQMFYISNIYWIQMSSTSLIFFQCMCNADFKLFFLARQFFMSQITVQVDAVNSDLTFPPAAKIH